MRKENNHEAFSGLTSCAEESRHGDVPMLHVRVSRSSSKKGSSLSRVTGSFVPKPPKELIQPRRTSELVLENGICLVWK
jgi:hypothetical protein